MHLGPREQAYRNSAAADAAAHEEVSAVAVLANAKDAVAIPAIERATGDDDWRAPGKGDLAAVRMAGEGDVEAAIVQCQQSVRTVHQDKACAFGAVQRRVRIGSSELDVIEAADPDVVVGRRETDV